MFTTKVKVLAMAAAMTAGSLGGLALSGPAAAGPPAGVITTITATDGSQGFSNIGNGPGAGDALAIDPFGDPRFNDGSLHMATATAASHVTMVTPLTAPQGQLNDISYQADLITGASPLSSSADISLNVTAWCNAAAHTGFITFVFEPYENSNQQAIATNQWQTWDASESGSAIWWTSKHFSTTNNGGLLSSGGVGGQSQDISWNSLTGAFFNACPAGGFTGIGFNLGSSNPGINAYADDLSYSSPAGSITDDFSIGAPTVKVITAIDGSQGFTNAGNATTNPGDALDISTTPDPTFGDGSLQMNTGNTASSHESMLTPITAAIGQLNDVSYRADLVAGTSPLVSSADISLNATAWCNATAQTGFITFVFEPYENQNQQAIATNTWQTWNASDGGSAIWWTNKHFSTTPNGGLVASGGIGGQSQFQAFTSLMAAFQTACPNGGFTSIGFNLGSSNPNISAFADDLGYTTPAGSVIDDFAIAAPVVTGISPTSGPLAGGNTVTIVGSNLANALSVKFGTTPAAIITDSAGTITVTAPPGILQQAVTVTTEGGTSALTPVDIYTYVSAPVISSIVPAFGPFSGGNTVTIYGSSFNNASSVKFGSTPATSYLVTSSTTISAVVPAGTGVVDVIINTPGGTSAAINADKYSYQAATSLVTQAAVLQVGPTISLLSGPAATLTSGGHPLAGQVINFTSLGGAPICSAVTNAFGQASCGALAAVITLLNLGYVAHYAGSPAYLPSSQGGAVIEVILGLRFL